MVVLTLYDNDKVVSCLKLKDERITAFEMKAVSGIRFHTGAQKLVGAELPMSFFMAFSRSAPQSVTEKQTEDIFAGFLEKFGNGQVLSADVYYESPKGKQAAGHYRFDDVHPPVIVRTHNGYRINGYVAEWSRMFWERQVS